MLVPEGTLCPCLPLQNARIATFETGAIFGVYLGVISSLLSNIYLNEVDRMFSTYAASEVKG